MPFSAFFWGFLWMPQAACSGVAPAPLAIALAASMASYLEPGRHAARLWGRS
jgi:hypothetical protein